MRWEIDKYIDFSFFGQFNGWYHITVCGNNDSKVTVMLESVGHNLGSYTHVRLLFFVSMDDIVAFETLDFLFRYFPNINLNFGFSLLAWKKASCLFRLPTSVGLAEKYFTAINS